MVDLAEIQAAYYMVAATGVLVAAVYYVMNMRATRKTQELALEAQQQSAETRQTQLFMQLLVLYDNKDFMNDYAVIAYDMQYDDLDDWVKKYGAKEARQCWASWARVGRFFDGAGILVKRGLIDSDLVVEEMREQILLTWDKVKPWVYEIRVKMRSPHTWENFEYLAGEARKKHPDFISTDD
jgi:hypothetical protein